MQEKWKCPDCGNVNDGEKCSACGKLKDATGAKFEESSLQQYLSMQLKQQEVLQQQEKEKREKRKEYNAQMEEYNRLYNEAPVKVIKQWSGSWLVLIMAVFASVAVLCALIALVVALDKGAFSILSSLVKILLAALVCAGFWRTWANGRSQNQPLDAGGPKMLRGVFTFYRVMMYIGMSLLLMLVILMFIFMKSCTDIATGAGTGFGNIIDQSGNTATSMGNINSGVTGILVGLLIIVIAVFALMIFFYESVRKFADDATNCFTTRTVNYAGGNCLRVAVAFFIVGGFSALSAFGPVIMSSALSTLINSFEGGLNSDFIGNALEGLLKINVADMLAQLSTAGLYITGGILALTYDKLNDSINLSRSGLTKPEMPE